MQIEERAVGDVVILDLKGKLTIGEGDEQLKDKMEIPAVLFYPGEFDGAAGLRFMGVLDAEHNYRPKIF